MRFSCAAIVALSSVAVCDAFFVAPSQQQQHLQTYSVTTTTTTTTALSMAGEWDNDGFLDGLSSSGGDNGEKSKRKDDENDGNGDEPGSGSSRFKALMEAAKAGAAGGLGGRVIENPFLSQSNSPPPIHPSNIDELSVEEQARRFREMMAQQQQGGGDVVPVAPTRTAKTDRAGRPVGRNRDADTIANTADLYFAQLKRDSTVRTLARIRGEDEKAESVFADEGVKQLEDVLVKNPYLKG
jgi:hypothetical protein